MRNAHKWSAVFAVLLAVGSARAEMKDEPTGFHGVQWDELFDVAGAQMTLLRDEGTVKYYKRIGGTLKFGHVNLRPPAVSAKTVISPR